MTSQKINSYKELRFWQVARKVSLEVVEITRRLPSEKVAWIIIDQLLRASFSVGANIAEGFGKYKGKEYSRFLQIALGSAREVGYWLELIKDIYPRLVLKVDSVLAQNEEVIKMLVVTLSSLRKRGN